MQNVLPSWAQKYNIEETALVDSAASLTLLMKNAPSAEAATQEANKTITIPNGTNMQTNKTLQLLLSKLPPAARRGFRLNKIMHNLVAVSELCDSGCEVRFNDEEVLITHNKEIISKGWRDKSTRLWRIPIVEKQQLTKEIIPKEQYANAAVQVSSIKVQVTSERY